METGLIVQGDPRYLDITLSALTSYEGPVVISTWDDITPSSLETYKEDYPDFHFLTNPKPMETGIRNSKWQASSTLAGVYHLSSMGIPRAIKIRTNILIQGDPNILKQCYDTPNLSILCCHTNEGVYPSDIVVGGPLDEIWAFFYENSTSLFSELSFLKAYLANKGLNVPHKTVSDLHSIFNMTLDKLQRLTSPYYFKCVKRYVYTLKGFMNCPNSRY